MVRLAPGERVGDRYRLDRELGRGRSSTTWAGFDERLDRPVCVRIFEGDLDRRELAKRAGQAASLTHPRAVRVFDTGYDRGHFYTVSELLGGSVASARRPLGPGEAVRLAIDVAEALAHAHGKGVVHGHLSEENVLLSSSGAKLGDFSLAAGDEASPHRDLADLGALLRRLVGAPSGPVPDRPGGFARVVGSLAEGGYGSAADLLGDLRSLDAGDVTAPPSPGRRWWVAPAVVVLVAAAIFGAMRLGERSPTTRLVPEGRIEGTALPFAAIEDFDPLGDGREGRSTLANIADGNPQTFWSTERYSGGPDFSGLKPGVGVLFDMGATVEVGKAQLLFPTPGCSFEVRYTDDPSVHVDEWRTAASVTNSPPAAPIVFAAASGRYWLVWITQLTRDVPGSAGSYACAVSGVELFAP